MDNKKYLMDKYSNGKEVKDPNFRQYFTFDELVDLLDSYQAEQLILSGVSTRYFFTRKDIWRAYLDGRFDELDETKGNMDVALYLDKKAKEYANNYSKPTKTK